MRVLLIDDDPACRRAARMMLERSGFEVAEAADGADGLKAFRQGGADVVLCDLFMPDVDGLEVIRRLREEAPAARVVAVSGGGNSGDADLLDVARLLGAAGTLHKPFRREELACAVREAAA
jgi:two-component system chemotaxis response regulator CheY